MRCVRRTRRGSTKNRFISNAYDFTVTADLGRGTISRDPLMVLRNAARDTWLDKNGCIIDGGNTVTSFHGLEIYAAREPSLCYLSFLFIHRLQLIRPRVTFFPFGLPKRSRATAFPFIGTIVRLRD